MRILAIYGNPKHGGFVHDCVDHVAERLAALGAEVDRLPLVDAHIEECTGCFTCLRTGACPLDDDVANIIERMRQPDAFVTGASVRNGYFPALYKRFFERITYIVGFGRELWGKHVLAIGAVGVATGKKHLGRMLTFHGFVTHVIDYLFFRTGIPTSIRVDDVAGRLDRAADRLHSAIERKAPLPLLARLGGALDNFAIRRFMLKSNPDGVYDYVIQRWKQQGWM
ncbi:flavodoxin family protein [bacterium]|nr:flavodoxin family protein [bacterium]